LAPDVERVTLSNGLVVLLLEDHDLPVVEFGLVLRAGMRHEPAGKAGLAALTAEVLRAGGSASYPGAQFNAQCELLGMDLEVRNDADSGLAGFSCPREHLKPALALFAQLLREPAFPQELLDTCLAEAGARLARGNDQPLELARREFLKAVYGPRDGRSHPLARQPDFDSLNAIARQDLLDFARLAFYPPHGVLSVYGDFRKPELLFELESAFGRWPSPGNSGTDQTSGLSPNSQAKPKRDARTLWFERPGGETAFAVGQVFEARRTGPDYPAVLLLDRGLNRDADGRLARAFTAPAVAVWGQLQAGHDLPGLYACCGVVRADKAGAALKALRETLAKVRREGLTEAEVVAARERARVELLFQCATPAKALARMREHALYGEPLEADAQLFEALERVSAEDVRRAARACLDPDRLTLVGVGPHPGGLDGKFGDRQDVLSEFPRRTPLVLDPEREARGRRLLAEALEAAGGVKAFQELKTLRTDMRFQAGSFNLRGVLRVLLPDHVRADIAGPLGAITQISTPEAAWQASGLWTRETPPLEARKNLRALVTTDLGILQLLAAGRVGYNVQALGNPGTDPTSGPSPNSPALLGVLLEATPFGRIRLYFDARTRLLAELHYLPEGAVREAVLTFSNHARFGKLTLARRMEDSDPKAKAKVVEIQAIQFNPELDPELFQRPRRATAPPDPLGP
jgi:zinc protease